MSHHDNGGLLASLAWAISGTIRLPLLLGSTFLFGGRVAPAVCRAEDKPANNPSPLGRLAAARIPAEAKLVSVHFLAPHVLHKEILSCADNSSS